MVGLGMAAILATMVSIIYPAAYTEESGGRYTIVVAVKHKQFLNLYEFLSQHAHNFDPRYAGALRTDGNPHDENKNLHITLASTALGSHNEKACEKALEAIAGYFTHEIHINFKPRSLSLDSDEHVKLPLIQDAGYNQLVQLQSIVVNVLRQNGATDIHNRAPNHVTIGFATKLPAHQYTGTVTFGRVTHARFYYWKGGRGVPFFPREVFDPLHEVQIYR